MGKIRNDNLFGFAWKGKSNTNRCHSGRNILKVNALFYLIIVCK